MAGVVLVAALVNSTAEGAGPGPGVAPAVPLSAESLTSNLLAVEVHDANDVLFQANSQYRTYWQVAVLNVLRNGVWVPDPDTQNAAHGAVSGAPVTQSRAGGTASGGSRDFTSAVQIDDLSSRILPVPPGTVAALRNRGQVDGRWSGLQHPDDVGTALHHPLDPSGDRTGVPWRQCTCDDIPARPRASRHGSSGPAAGH